MDGGWILVAESDEQQAAKLVALLEEHGLETVVTRTALQALHALDLRPGCRLVIAADELSGGTGFSLLNWVAAAHDGLGVMLCVEKADLALVTRAFRAGAADVLVKPVEKPVLAAALERTLEEFDSRKNNALYINKLQRMVLERTHQLRELMADLERSYDVTIEAMGDALDLRDEETEGHSKRVTAYTIALARSLKLSGGQIKTIARGAFLHDIGKIAIPDSILLKPGRLTAEEMKIMRGHCEAGYTIVRKIPFLADAAEIVYAHQERFDGSGYPRGLRGQEIPLGARIFALVDALDAITSDRPYRSASTFPEAMREIVAARGRQFDPDIVDAFLQMPCTTWPAIRAETGRHWSAAEKVRAAAA